MDVREKLVELLYSIPAPEPIVGIRAGKRLMTAGFIADHLIASGVTVQRWIPVTERLPDETKDEYVLVVCNYYGTIKVETRKMWHIESVVTHWMPLPEPPKEEE